MGWISKKKLRNEMVVLGCLVTGDIYVYDILTKTGLSSATVYPALTRLKQKGLVWSRWVDQPDGMRRLRYGLNRTWAIREAGRLGSVHQEEVK